MLFIESRIKRERLRLLFITFEPTIPGVCSRDEHLSVIHIHVHRRYTHIYTRPKSFNAIVLSRLIKFPSILRISPMRLNRNSRLRDRSQEPTMQETMEEEKFRKEGSSLRKWRSWKKNVRTPQDLSIPCARARRRVQRPYGRVDTWSLHGSESNRGKEWNDEDCSGASTKVEDRSNNRQ